MKERGLSMAQLEEKDIQNYCANTSTLVCLNYHPIHEEFLKYPLKETLNSEFPDKESLICWYALVRASLRYQKKCKKYPGEKVAHDKVFFVNTIIGSI